MEIARLAFVAELSKLYDSECRALTMLPDLAEQFSSIRLRRILNRYIVGSRLTIGKIEILFHLMNSKIVAAEDKFFTPIFKSLMTTHLDLPNDVKDIYITARIQRLLHLKVAGCETLMLISERTCSKAATSILKEICDYHSSMLKEFSLSAIHKKNDYEYAMVRK